MPKSHTGRAILDRRSAILAGTAFVGAAAIPSAALRAAEAGLAPAGDLLAAVRKFLASLEPDKRKAASFAWNGPEWRSWNYFGVGGYIKPGLRLEQMSAEQKAAAWDLLATWQSPAGLAKTKNVMMLQDCWRQAATAPASAPPSGSPSPSSARRPRPARGAFASKGTT